MNEIFIHLALYLVSIHKGLPAFITLLYFYIFGKLHSMFNCSFYNITVGFFELDCTNKKQLGKKCENILQSLLQLIV